MYTRQPQQIMTAATQILCQLIGNNGDTDLTDEIYIRRAVSLAISLAEEVHRQTC